MIDEKFEFSLSQYLDGTLPVDEAAAFFDELAKNPAAMAMLDEYRRLDLLLKADVPTNINWDGLAEDISEQIDEQSRSRLRIGLLTRPLRAAMAAAVLLAVGVAGWMALHRVSGPATPVSIVQIAGPTAEAAAAPAVAQIQIGPANDLAATENPYRYTELAPRPARVVIASGVEVRQDERTSPY